MIWERKRVHKVLERREKGREQGKGKQRRKPKENSQKKATNDDLGRGEEWNRGRDSLLRNPYAKKIRKKSDIWQKNTTDRREELELSLIHI